MSKKTTTKTTEASTEDRQHVQGIGDNNKGANRSTTGTVDWKRQRSVALIDIALLTVTLSRICLVAVLFWYYFHQIPSF